MASVPGRPYKVGFDLRIIGATAATSVDVTTVTEYTFETANFNLVGTRELLTTAPYKLGRGLHLEFTAGRNNDNFTVVYVECTRRCEVGLQHLPDFWRCFDLVRNCNDHVSSET